MLGFDFVLGSVMIDFYLRGEWLSFSISGVFCLFVSALFFCLVFVPPSQLPLFNVIQSFCQSLAKGNKSHLLLSNLEKILMWKQIKAGN